MTAEVPVTAESLGYQYGHHLALSEISFELRPGVTALVGVNGAGKTTLLQLLATRTFATHGRVVFAERQQVPGLGGRDLSALRRTIALAPQEFDVPRHLRVDDFMRYMAWVRAIPRRQREHAITAALEAVELAGRRTDRIGSLSGGMRRRLNIAQALLDRPRLLLLDEPFAGLDPEQRARLRDQIAALDQRTTIVISSHELQDVGLIAPRVLMLAAGRIVYDGTRADLEQLGRTSVVPGSRVAPLEAAFLALQQSGVRP